MKEEVTKEYLGVDTKWKYGRTPCAAMIDQGRYIGKDPVGHKCGNDSELLYSIAPNDPVLVAVFPKFTFRMCFSCSEKLILGVEADRLSFRLSDSLELSEGGKYYGRVLQILQSIRDNSADESDPEVRAVRALQGVQVPEDVPNGLE